MAASHFLPHEWNDVPAEVDGVVEDVVSASGKDPHPEVVIIEQRGGNCLRRADQLAVELPLPPVSPVGAVHSARSCRSPAATAASSRCEPEFSGLPLRRKLDRPAAWSLIRPRMLFGLGPGEFLGGRDDGTECHLQGRPRLAGRRGGGIDGRNLLLRGRTARPRAHRHRLGRTDGIGGRGRPAERMLRPRLLHREDVRDEILYLVILPS